MFANWRSTEIDKKSATTGSGLYHAKIEYEARWTTRFDCSSLVNITFDTNECSFILWKAVVLTSPRVTRPGSTRPRFDLLTQNISPPQPASLIDQTGKWHCDTRTIIFNRKLHKQRILDFYLNLRLPSGSGGNNLCAFQTPFYTHARILKKRFCHPIKWSPINTSLCLIIEDFRWIISFS